MRTSWRQPPRPRSSGPGVALAALLLTSGYASPSPGPSRGSHPNAWRVPSAALVVAPSSPVIENASTTRGVGRTADGQRRPQPRGHGLEGLTIRCLAIDPRGSHAVYAATDTGGVFRSLDGGEHWSPANTGLSGRSFGALVVDSREPSILYAGSASGRLYRSTDGGDSWKESVTAPSSAAIISIALDPSRPGTIYVGTAARDGVFRSLDGGATWAPLIGEPKGKRP